MGTIIIPDKLIYHLESKLVAKSVELKRSLFPHEVTTIMVEAIKYFDMHLVKKEKNDYARTK